MEIHQIQYFVSAAKCLNFTQAARECCIVPSAMTQQIASLEKELSVKLFGKNGRTIYLTAEGEAFLQGAKKILKDVEDTVKFTHAVRDGYSKLLKIGCHGNIMRDELPDYLRAFHRLLPKVKVTLVQGGISELIDALEKERIDCMLSVYYPQYELYPWMENKIIHENHVSLMMSQDHPFAEREAISRKDLKEEPFVLLSGDEKQEKIVQWAQEGAPLTIYERVDNQSCLETLVASGYGVSLCVDSARRHHSGICYKRISDMEETLGISMAWKKENPNLPVIQSLLEIIQNS